MIASPDADLGTLPLRATLPAREYAAFVAFSETNGFDVPDLAGRVLIEFLHGQLGKQPHERRATGSTTASC